MNISKPDVSTSYRVGSNIPIQYRLCTKQTGEVVLQGMYQWTEFGTCGNSGGHASMGHDWKDLPMHYETLSAIKL